MDIKKLLEVEKDTSIFRYKITKYNLPIWLFIRSNLGISYLPSILGLNSTPVQISTSELSLRDRLTYAIHALIRNCFRARKKDVLIFGSGINNVLERTYYVNRLYDPFWSAFKEKILLLEKSHGFKFLTPRFNDQVLYSDTISVVAKILSRLNFLSKKDKNTIDSFFEYLNSKLLSVFSMDFSNYCETEKLNILDTASKLVPKMQMYQIILRLTQPKLIIVEDGHYGVHTDLIYAAKQRNIKVAEYQHGFIGPVHFAYNYHPATYPFIRPYLPDYMLFWGKYWMDYANIPGQKIVIGFPYLEEKTRGLRAEDKEDIILLISGSTVPEEVIHFGLSLTGLHELRNYRLLFRPHPRERLVAAKRYKELLDAGYELDSSNLYTTLQKAQICIGLETSTVLYEAVAFRCKTFLKPSFSSSLNQGEKLPFDVFESPDQLLEKLRTALTVKTDLEDKRDILFSNNSIENFRNFYSSEC